jgi:serine O-acetyltransferase
MHFKTTLDYLSADMQRRLALKTLPFTFSHVLCELFKPGMMAVILYRLSYYLAKNRIPLLPTLLFWLNYLYGASNEISPKAEIGSGLVLGDLGAHGLSCYCRIGRNLTLLGENTITMGAIEGIDFDRDFISIGDDVTLEAGAKIMKPVTIANGVRIRANSLVMKSQMQVGAVLIGVPARDETKLKALIA